MSNLLIRLNIWLNTLLAFLGLRHKDDRWGIVYDSVNKQPLDPVIVKLINAVTGKVVQTSVTDLSGRFNFLAYPGKFKILVKKSNYLFPSTKLLGDNDEIYKNLYHGEFFTLSGDSDVIDFNIPMDPENPDWNQTAKQKLTAYHPYWENFFYGLTVLVFWSVLLLDILTLKFYPTKFSYWLLYFYIFVILLWVFLPQPRWWGKVSLKNGGSTEGLVVELSYKAMPTMVLVKANVFDDGKFFLRVLPGKYLMQIKRYSDNLAPQVLYAKNIRVGYEQVLNRSFTI